MTPSQRIKRAMEYVGVKAPTLAKKIGFKSKGTIYAILKEENSVSEKFLLGFCTQYPQISYKYLKSGNGDMVLSTAEMVVQRNLLGNKPEETFEEIMITSIEMMKEEMIQMRNTLTQIKSDLRKGETERVNKKRKRITHSRK